MSATTDRFYADIFTTAVEGGIGYWSHSLNYHWMHDDGTSDLRGFYSDIIVPVNDLPKGMTPDKVTTEELYWWPTEVAHFRIDRKVITRGYKLATSPEWRVRMGWSTCQPPLVLTEESIEDWDYDSLDADAIVQLGLFGEVVYG